MRLIDADALVKYFEGLAVSLANVECFAAADAAQTAAETLKLAPTIDAEPVRHGRWVKPYPNDIWDCYECSNCGAKYGRTWKHCPDCGAEMDFRGAHGKVRSKDEQ